MKNGVLNTITVCCLCFAAFIFPKQASATHIDGADMYYTHVNLDTYRITVVIYGNCGGVAFHNLYNATAQVKVYEDPSNTVVATLNLGIQAPDSGLAILACPNDSATTCVNPNNTIPGIKKFVFSTLYKVPHPSANWRFQFYGNLGATQAGRSTTITNVTNPGNTIICLTAKLNNATADNSSPLYDSLLSPYYCVNIASDYWPTYVDPDGDSLTFHLISGKDGTGVPATPPSVTYISPYTADSPMAATPFALDSTNGHLSFTAVQIQRSLVAMQIDEYRANAFVGSQTREMTVVVINACSTSPPCIQPFQQMAVSQLLEPEFVKISPNPAGDVLNITSGSNIKELVVVNAMGQEVMALSCNDTRLALNTKTLIRGIYFVVLKTATGQVVRERFVKD